MIRNVSDYVDVAAERYPDKIAFVDEKRAITYLELKNEAMIMCMAIRERSLIRKPIAICVERSISCIVAMLAVAYSGNYYSVIDISAPFEKQTQILHFFEPSLVIADENSRENIAGLSFDTLNIDIVRDNDKKEYSLQKYEGALSSDPLCVLFTSGSTGEPKGVVLSHKAVIAYAEAGVEAYGLMENDVFGNTYNFYWVASIADIFFSLALAATVVVFPEKMIFSPYKLVSSIVDSNVTVIQCSPSLLTLLVRFDIFEQCDVSCVREIIFGGETIQNSVLLEVIKRMPRTKFINAYGATEVTDACTFYVIDNDSFDGLTDIPLGRSLNNSEIILLDEENNISNYGELCVRGESLAIGYYKNTSETQNRFIPNPNQKKYEELLYRTGDIAKINDNGELVFCGRLDNQIKIHGHRIELEEIESIASGIEGILENCCFFTSEVVLVYSGTIQEDQVLEVFRKRANNYMIPARILRVDNLPHNSNMKIDRKEIKRIYG